MTVEQCANDLAEAFKAGWLRKGATMKEVAEVVAGKLRAIILTESTRAAGICRGQGCDRAADEIVCTSPGKVAGR
jgi:hypothetical protein